MPRFPEPCTSGSEWASVLVLLYCLGKSVVAEVYPSLWTRRFPRDDRDGDEQAAYAVATWLQRADENGSLGNFFSPSLTAEETKIAKIERWILGVV
jgi:hypothetical protein